MPPSPPPTGALSSRSLWWQRGSRLARAAVRAFHAYANWLVGISWRRFILLSVLLMVAVGILQEVPPFSWRWSRTVSSVPALPNVVVRIPELPEPPAPPAAPQPRVLAPGATASADPADQGSKDAKSAPSGKPKPDEGIEIIIDGRGVRIGPKTPKPAATPASAPGAVASAPTAAEAPASAASAKDTVRIQVPQGLASEVIREVLTETHGALQEALEEARRDLEEARSDVQQARADVQQAVADAEQAREEVRNAGSQSREALREAARQSRRTAEELAHSVAEQLREQGMVIETRETSLGEALPPMALLWIVASLIIKITYRRQIQAEAQAAQAVETAEAESLRRQVLEARVAAMQAQVEPHFLFNTLASIDHLIEVDPQRASQMQKNLIALLRASMPTMRDTHSDGGSRDLRRELAVVRPYLEILKVRMDERLSVDIDVPEGLESAEFPSMMVQTLVENAIKHGLEPKPEGGHLQVKAEIVHGDLQVSVADTGMGFGRAGTSGTGVGLANTRERLQLLYGSRGGLTIAENPGGGTRVTIRVPYRPIGGPAYG